MVGNFDHLEAGLGRSAVRTDPVLGNVGPTRARCDTMLGQATCLVIGEAAAGAQILLHADLVASVKMGETDEVRRLRPHRPRRVRARPAGRPAAAPDRTLRAGALSPPLTVRPTCHTARLRALAP